MAARQGVVEEHLRKAQVIADGESDLPSSDLHDKQLSPRSEVLRLIEQRDEMHLVVRAGCHAVRCHQM